MATRTKKPSTLVLIVVLLTGCARAERFNTAQEINDECRLEMQAASTAVHLRDKGKPKSFLLEALPPVNEQSSRLLINMHAIVAEVYQYKTLNEMIYPTYRHAICLRALQHKPIPPTLTAIETDLLICQQQFGLESNEHSTRCVSSVIDKYSNEQPGKGAPP